jgi:hypothetical protein
MKMFFSTNKPIVSRNINTEPKKEKVQIDSRSKFNDSSLVLRYGMVAKLQNYSGCSSCGK